VSDKEATARIKINKLLEAAGWRFFADGKLPANIQLEPSITIKSQELDVFGENFEKSSKGYIDFLLENNDTDDREYADATDQIREVLIHQHYLSQKDIEICAAFDIAKEFGMQPNFPSIEFPHQTLCKSVSHEI